MTNPVVAVPGAVTVNTNEAPPLSTDNDERLVPRTVMGVKSDTNPVVNTEPVFDVIVQVKRSPIRIGGAVKSTHVNVEVDVGLPYTVYVIGLLTRFKIDPDKVALTWKLVVAVAGALTLKVNDEPVPSDESAVNPTPTLESGAKSEINPVVAEAALIAVIVQLIVSPIRTTVASVVHESTDVVVGLPNTVYVFGLP